MLPAQWVEESWSWNSFPDVEIVPCACGGDKPERQREETGTIESRSDVKKSCKTGNSDITHITYKLLSAEDVKETRDRFPGTSGRNGS